MDTKTNKTKVNASNEATNKNHSQHYPENGIVKWLTKRGICTHTNGNLCVGFYHKLLKTYVKDCDIPLITDVKIINVKRKEIIVLERTVNVNFTDFTNYVIDNIPKYIIQFEQ